MKKLIVAAAAALAWAGAANAEYVNNTQHHNKASLTCSECHVMHASRSHSFTSAAADSRYGTTIQPSGTGYAHLLVADGTNATCLSCHDDANGASQTDVFGAKIATNTLMRAAGGLNGTVVGHPVGGVYADYMGHTLGSAAAPPGWTSATAWNAGAGGFNCSNCHAVHGGAANAWRNLGGSIYMGAAAQIADPANPFLTNYPTYTENDVFDPSVDVTKLVTRGTLGSKDTRIATIGLGTSNATNGSVQNGLNAYCANCHGQFHGTANTESAGAFIRHPTSGVQNAAADFFQTGFVVNPGTTGQDRVVRPAWVAADKANFEVACVSCHRAHGTNHAFGLIWPGAAAATVVDYENGDGLKFQSLCATCHPQARGVTGM